MSNNSNEDVTSDKIRISGYRVDSSDILQITEQINKMLPDMIAFPIQHLLGLHIWAADEPNAVSFRVAVGHHVNAV